MSWFAKLFIRMTFKHFSAKWQYWLEKMEQAGFSLEPNLSHQVARPSWSTQLVPGVIVFLFGIRALIFLLFASVFTTPYRRLVVFIAMLPDFVQSIGDILFLVWACLYLLTIVYECTRPLICFKHLLLITVRPEGAIKPEHIGLTPRQYVSFERMRKWTLRYVGVHISYISWLALIILTISAIMEQCFTISWLLTISWLPIFLLYVYYICYSAYAVPILFVIIAYYLHLRQNLLLQRLAILEDLCHNLVHKSIHHPGFRLNRSKKIISAYFRRINSMQVALSNEIETYNKHFWSYFLTCFCSMFSILITYLTYLIFFLKNVPIYGYVIFDCVWLAHVAFMAVVIFSSNRITRNHRKYQNKLAHFYNLGCHLNIFNSRDLIRIDNILANEQGRANGFYLKNDYLIESMTFITVIKYVSTFFFLVFA